MLDGISLDQLRTFIAAVDEGSFSAAGRKLGRAQSVVSQTLAKLEGQIGVRLFERGARYPVLTPGGRALLANARAVAGGMDQFKAQARSIAGGLEPELNIVVSVMFPTETLTCAVAAFQAEFPNTLLRITVEGLGAVIEPVLAGRCAFGIGGFLPVIPKELGSEHLLHIRYQMVASPAHPLAAHPGAIPTRLLAKHVQLVLSDRSSLTEGTDFGVFSPKTWRLSDLGAKHAFLKAGLGWGGMPFEVVREDLASGALVALTLESMDTHVSMPMLGIYRTVAPPGPAGRWLIEHLKHATAAGREIGPASGAKAPAGTGQAPASVCQLSPPSG